MEMTYEPKTTQAAPEKAPRAAAPTAAGGIPNSAMLSMLGASDDPPKNSTDALEAAIMSRLPQMRGRPQPQIPSAEREADRLSASVTFGSPGAVKAAMGARLGADLSGVRFHTDAASAARADAMGARAFTAGADVYFGGEGFDPAVAAHELVHTVQQGAVAGGAETVSAPLGGVQMWGGGRKKKSQPVNTMTPPAQVRFDKPMQPLKGMRGNAPGASVAMADTEDNQKAVVKLDTDAEAEQAMAAFYNTAGNVFNELHGGAWNFGAANFRPLLPNERPGAWQAIDDQQLGDLTGDIKDNLNRMGVFTAATGVYQANYGQRVPEDKNDYRRMLGYVSLLDMSVGMHDRFTKLFNDNNWVLDTQTKKAEMIDNVPETLKSDGTLREREVWLNDYLRSLTSPGFGKGRRGGSNGDPEAGTYQYLKNMFDPLADQPVEKGKILVGGEGEGQGEYALSGIKEALGDLPEIRKQLEKQFTQESGGKLNEVQKEVLERMQITHEYMMDPKMAAIYDRLGEIGLSPRDNEDPSVAKERTKLLRKRDFRRSPLQWFKNLFHRK